MSADRPFALVLSIALMIVIVSLRYLASSGLFAWLGERTMRGLHEGKARQIRREIGWSLLTCAIYALPAGVVAWGWQARGWTRIYDRWETWPLWWLPASLVVYLFLHDSWFYWTHRAMHHPALFARMHAVHHASRPPTAWAAMSFHPLEAITGAFVVPLLTLLVPIHVAVLGLVLLVMTVMGVTNHMGWEMFPSRLVRGPAGRWLITATHHQLHHDRYLCNYGLYTRVWDRLCRTDRGLGTLPAARNGSAPDLRHG